MTPNASGTIKPRFHGVILSFTTKIMCDQEFQFTCDILRRQVIRVKINSRRSLCSRVSERFPVLFDRDDSVPRPDLGFDSALRIPEQSLNDTRSTPNTSDINDIYLTYI